MVCIVVLTGWSWNGGWWRGGREGFRAMRAMEVDHIGTWIVFAMDRVPVLLLSLDQICGLVHRCLVPSAIALLPHFSTSRVHTIHDQLQPHHLHLRPCPRSPHTPKSSHPTPASHHSPCRRPHPSSYSQSFAPREYFRRRHLLRLVPVRRRRVCCRARVWRRR